MRLQGQEVHLNTTQVDRKWTEVPGPGRGWTAGRTVVLLPWKKSRLSGLDVFKTRLSVFQFLDSDSGL